MSMLSFVALSPGSCTPQEVDSFCLVYNQVILQKGDGSISATTGVKRRLLANELTYRQLCMSKT
jgi:hypothetical protein